MTAAADLALELHRLRACTRSGCSRPRSCWFIRSSAASPAAIYNQVLQFFLIVLGFAPLAILAVMKAGGWQGMASRLPPVMTHTWSDVHRAADNPIGVEVFGLIAGLGFVLSFGYWCTDFLVVQRAMAADSISSARRTP